jgi:hypothetical protein
MGYTRHHAIIVTTWDKATIKEVHKTAKRLFPSQMVSDVLRGTINGYYTVFVGPDGSKEGWPESDKGNARRAHFIEHLHTLFLAAWVEVQYCDEEGDEKITRSSMKEVACEKCNKIQIQVPEILEDRHGKHLCRECAIEFDEESLSKEI